MNGELKIKSVDKMFTMTDYDCEDRTGRPVRVRVCEDTIFIFERGAS